MVDVLLFCLIVPSYKSNTKVFTITLFLFIKYQCRQAYLLQCWVYKIGEEKLVYVSLQIIRMSSPAFRPSNAIALLH